MANEVYQLTSYIINEFKDNPIVNTISFEKTSEIDFNKENIYPLVNVDLVSTPPITNLIRVNYVITILQQRDYENSLNNDKLLNKDNLIDNLNETYTILTRFINSFNTMTEDIDLVSTSDIEFVKNEGTQNLDGVRITIVLEIVNSTPC